MQSRIRKLAGHVREYGLQGTAAAAADRILKRRPREVSYERWLERSRYSSWDYLKMSRKKLGSNPVFAVRSYADHSERAAFIQSLETQIYRKYHTLKECPDADYILLCASGCTLSPAVLWKCAEYLSAEEEVDLIYFDSDRIGLDGRKKEPSFRPDYDPDLLSQVNYMGDVVLVSTAAAMKAGLPGHGPDAFHEFLKRVCFSHTVRGGEEADCAIRHIPEVLYHVFEKDGDGNLSGEEETEPVREAVMDMREGAEEPLISVLIPNKDHIADLKRCISSLLQVNTWQNLEILILENNSAEQETFQYYEELQRSDGRIRVLTYDRPFNYSAVNNFGLANAAGSLILLLNNDTQILEKDSIARLACLAMREDVGAAGALLLYPDLTVQHAGIILGYGGIAGHAFTGEECEGPGDAYPDLVFHHIHNVCAVTGACLMLRRSVFLRAGGFDEDLKVAFNDVDLCMRLRSEGLRVLLCPQAVLIHNESVSRGSEDSPEKVARFHDEIRTFIGKWERELKEGDPFYNPNLTLTGRSWTCRDLLREPVKPYIKYLDLQ